MQDGISTGTPPFNPAAVNYIRMYNDSDSEMTLYIDDIYICNIRGAKYDESNTIASGNVADAMNVPLPMLLSCDNDLGVTQATLNSDPTYIKVGTGSLKAAITGTERLVYAMPGSKDISEYKKGYLHMWVYINDIKLLGDGQIELTSGGTCDIEELAWNIQSYVKKSGWNELYLPLSSPSFTTGGKFDPTSCNYLRVYNTWTASDTEPLMFFDDIRLTTEKK